MQSTWVVHLLLLVLIIYASSARTVAATQLPPCSTDEEKQFSVTVTTAEPLGLRLSDRLEVLEFVADAQGRSRAVEASGLAEIGDRLVQVNDKLLRGRTLADAVASLSTASLPKILRFETHDGRCQVPPAASEPQQARALQAADESAQTFDYVLLSMGEKASESTFFGVLSADGKPPSCSFHEVDVAFPFDACSALSTNATDKYVIVPTMSGCPAHQKAAFIQDAGARGVIFVQHEGHKPQQIRIPADLPSAITLPLVMVAMDSGVSMIEQLSRAHISQTPRIRFVFSAACAADRFEVHPDDDPLALSMQARIKSARAGFVTVSTADSGASTLSTTAFEFLKPSTSASTASALPLGKHDVVLPDSGTVQPCARSGDAVDRSSSNSESQLQDQWVVLTLDPTCGLAQQLANIANLRVRGVIFADAAFPAAAHARATMRAARESPLPFVFVSSAALAAIARIARIARADAAVHVQVEFTGENALQHHWHDLAALADPAHWPSSAISRDRLVHRVLKDHAAVRDHDTQRQLARNERYDALIALYWRAQRFYMERESELSSDDDNNTP